MKNNQLFSFFTDPSEKMAKECLDAWIVAEEPLMTYFEEIEEEGALPDLFGKTVMVSETQFPKANTLIRKISNILELPQPLCFVYDSYRYEIDSEGVKTPRLEISVKILQDFSENELAHVLAKEIFHIKAGHVRTKVLVSKIVKLLGILPELPVVNILKQFGSNVAFDATVFHFRSAAFNWYKAACFSAERFGLACANEIKASINATLLTILNSKSLVNEIDLSAYLCQISKIESCLGPIATIEMTNEAIPYGPYRILNMLNFAQSEKFLQAADLIKKSWAI